MKLKHLTLENFAGLPHLDLDFGDGESAVIYGDNGTGKTTVKNAVEWLLFGAPVGTKNYSPKTKTESGEAHRLNHAAEGTFETTEGTVTLRAVYHEVYRKIAGLPEETLYGHTTDYTVDGVPVKEKEYFARVSQLIGADAERARICMVPSYFAETLPWQERRQYLFSTFGGMTQAEVLAGREDLEPLAERLAIEGTSRTRAVCDFRKIAAGQKKEAQKKLAAINGRMDEARQNLLGYRDITDTLEQATEKKDEAKAEYERASKELERAKENNAAAMREELRLLEARGNQVREEMRKVEQNYLRRQSEGSKAYYEEQAKLSSAFSAAMAEERSASGVLQEIREQRETIAAAKKEIKRQYDEEMAKHFLAKKNCPTCGQPFPPEQLERVKAEWERDHFDRLNALNDEFDRLDKKLRSASLASREREASNRRKDALKLRDTAAEKLAQMPEKPPMGDDPLGYTSLPEWQALDEQSGRLASARDERARKIGAADLENPEIAALEEREKDAWREWHRLEESVIPQIRKRDAAAARVDEIAAEEKATVKELERAELDLYLCDMYDKAQAEMLTEKFNAPFHSVKFRLFEEQMNGGQKDTCEAMVNCGGKWVPFALANHGAQVNAGLEIIRVFSEAFGITMPVLIDNAESVTSYPETQGQLIRFQVREGETTLRTVLIQD